MQNKEKSDLLGTVGILLMVSSFFAFFRDISSFLQWFRTPLASFRISLITVNNIINLLIGFYGMRNYKNPKVSRICFWLGITSIALNMVALGLYVFINPSWLGEMRNTFISSRLGLRLILPVLYTVGAFSMVKRKVYKLDVAIVLSLLVIGTSILVGFRMYDQRLEQIRIERLIDAELNSFYWLLIDYRIDSEYLDLPLTSDALKEDNLPHFINLLEYLNERELLDVDKIPMILDRLRLFHRWELGD